MLPIHPGFRASKGESNEGDSGMREKITVNCSICGKPVPLEQCKSDDPGRPAHEDCYAARVVGVKKSAATPYLVPVGSTHPGSGGTNNRLSPFTFHPKAPYLLATSIICW
jgi:hypothetical protein